MGLNESGIWIKWIYRERERDGERKRELSSSAIPSPSYQLLIKCRASHAGSSRLWLITQTPLQEVVNCKIPHIHIHSYMHTNSHLWCLQAADTINMQDM